MKIIINGKNQTLEHAQNLKDFIEHSCADPNAVIAEVNEKIVKRDAWGNFSLKDNDRVELVTFVGGG